jgi:DNA-binding NarL/FixJ family response regulator
VPHLRVLIADDDSRVRRSLRILLVQQPDIEVVGEANAGEDLLGAVRALRPNRVLLDVRTTGSGGFDLVRRIHDIDPSVCVVVLSVYADQLAEALRAGAGHYLLKGCPIEDLVRALRRPCCQRLAPAPVLNAQGVS